MTAALKRTLQDAARVVGGRLLGEDKPYGAVATDSRTLNPGSLFVALKEARPNDLVLIAGKGHEDYQIYGETRRSFSDRGEALRYLGAAA